MATHLCLSGVRAIVKLEEELTRPGTEEARVSLKFREETIWTGHLNPDESHIQIFLIKAKYAMLR